MCPALTDWLEVERQEMLIEDVKEADAEKWLQDECPITMVYVCTKDEIANLRIARLLLRMFEKEKYQNLWGVKVVALDPPEGCILEELSKRNENKKGFKLFSLTRSEKTGSRSPVAANLLTETDDAFAKQLHEDYCKEEDKKLKLNPHHKKKPAHQAWSLLGETYRESNRSSADHIEVKLRAVGRTLVPRAEGIAAPLSEDEIELLACIEHNRWWAERALDGWQYSQNRDDSLRRHHNMLPYDDLDQETKDNDKKNVRKMLAIAAGDDHVLALRTEPVLLD
jgi:hypothetical protein